jgi:hypothetical protein
MQTGPCLRSAQATAPGKRRSLGSIAVLALGLAVSACVSGGQLANLTETARPTIAIESIAAPPSTDVPRFVTMLRDEAAERRIAAGAPSEANYRLHGYLDARTDNAAAPAGATAPLATTSIAWMLDVYDGDQHRLVRLSGEEKMAGRASASTDDQALRRVARAGMDQLAAFLATSRTPSTAAVAAPAPRTAAGWLDDWTPEASGIFRIFGREPAPPAAAARVHAPADDVPLPRGRPAAPPSTAVTIATADPAENAR